MTKQHKERRWRKGWNGLTRKWIKGAWWNQYKNSIVIISACNMHESNTGRSRISSIWTVPSIPVPKCTTVRSSRLWYAVREEKEGVEEWPGGETRWRSRKYTPINGPSLLRPTERERGGGSQYPFSSTRLLKIIIYSFLHIPKAFHVCVCV